MTVAPIFSVVIIHIRTSQTLYRFADTLLTLSYQQMEVVTHKAIGVIYAVRAAWVPIVIITFANSVQSYDKLVIIFDILKDILMINPSHHHMIDASSRGLP